MKTKFNLWFFFFRNCRFISTSNTLSSVPTKSKIVTEKTVTPRTYHDDNVSEESSNNPLKYSSTKAVYGPRVENLGIGFTPPQKSRPKWEAPSLTLSMLTFMLYFFVFREEGGIDQYIANISDPNLAGEEMKQTIKEYKKQGKDTSGMEASYEAWEKEQKLAKLKAMNAWNKIFSEQIKDSVFENVTRGWTKKKCTTFGLCSI